MENKKTINQKQRIIILLVMAVLVLTLTVFAAWKFFIGKNSLEVIEQTIDQNDLESKYNLDILNNEKFKILQSAPTIGTTIIEGLGRENPFLEIE